MKIAIIGAGPAGLSAARKAAAGGAEVTVFEKKRVGEGIVCGECIFDFFGVLQKPESGLLFEVEKIIVRVHDTYSKQVIDYNRLWMIDRAVWQRGLAAQAQTVGARIIENHEVSVRELQDISDSHDFVIDCSGAPCVTARAYKFHQEYLKSFSVACQYRLAGDFSQYGKSIYLGFLPGIPQENMPGYYWIFPRSEGTAYVGIGYRAGNNGKTVNLWKKLDEVIDRENLGQMRVLGKGGGFLPIARPQKLVHDNIILAGDAAGITSEFSGEGIDLALISGAVAAGAALSADAAAYDKRIGQLLQEKLRFDKSVADFFKNGSFEDCDAMVDMVFNKKLAFNPKVVKLAYRVMKLAVSFKKRKQMLSPEILN